MEAKAFDYTFHSCTKGGIMKYYDEIDFQLFFGFLEELKDCIIYDHLNKLRELAHGDLDVSDVDGKKTAIQLTPDFQTNQKVMMYFLRYHQLLASLTGMKPKFIRNIHHDFHIFGTLVRGNEMFPYIPDNMRCLLLRSDILKTAVYQVVKGKDPMAALNMANGRQPKGFSYKEQTSSYTFQVIAISYIALKSSTEIPGDECFVPRLVQKSPDVNDDESSGDELNIIV
ncbi:hypothetical protein [blackberry leaf mottle-associated virus]|uniref:Uncharacterized protein n=1 Tax=blackberry leaf mottle-associated virus TaxID=3070201 RepID=A0A1W5RUL9_9VIRU|nr:hypothetical protein QK580_s5gp1 [blackberry leaf mottle-associated virus]AQX45477.1 hypothetical protein [blackberry leaf mottle-associated virus]